MSKHCLVTGGAGFIGSNLVRALVDKGWLVDVVDDLSGGRCELLDGLDWGDANVTVDRPVTVSFKRYQNKSVLTLIEDGIYDIIFHQAAMPRVLYSVENPAETLEENLLGTVKLFEAALVKNTPVVWASSSSVYGDAITPTAECQVGNNQNSPYAMQKRHAENYAQLFGELYGLRSIGLRYFNVFGPGQYGDSAYSTAVSAWCHAVKHGLPLRSDGDGEQSRDMCYIDNVISANLKAAELLMSTNKLATEGRCYNVGSGKAVTNNEILEFFKRRFGDRVKIQHAPERPGDVRHTLSDLTRIEKDLGYEVEVQFWDGLERTFTWWDLT